MNQQDDLDNENLIEIRDPDIDTLALLEQVRERIKKRRAQWGYEPQSFPSFGGSGMPEQLDGSNLDPNLFHYLELVNSSYFDFATEPDLQLSPATRGRILGRIWSLIRRQAHQLVLFYVNRNIEHQVAVNRQLVSIVNLLARTLQDQQREIMDLRQRLDESQADRDQEKGSGS